MMTQPGFFARAAVGLLALYAVGCFAMKSGTLSTGMTPDQAVRAMGQPDLQDNIADPNHNGASVLRYVWLQPGKAAIFGSDYRVASIQDVETNTKQRVEQEARVEAAGPPPQFDPLETPLNYFFFPVKAGLIYIGAGLNCVGGGACRQPELPPPGSAG